MYHHGLSWSVFVVWTHTMISLVVISQECFKCELCLGNGWLTFQQYNLWTALSKNNQNLCMWDEWLRCNSCQNYLRKTPHLTVMKSEQCCVVVPSFHGLCMKHLGPWPPFWWPTTACIFWCGLSYRSPSKITIFSSYIMFDKKATRQV